ncbi:TPA: colicin immunity protein Cui [Serratia marcescens]|uniref:colicin immunity protein Cui n=2 Tax=Gammaproteobacteria TaxID=1236 RepID=UPI0013016660|nr:colicin immunity protein Cui [Serratia marcescens]HED1523254.1 colicin immunity protein Cui [Serratia marcescens]HED2344393.1 colicin immunity protein Cui [Serratia marcescens]HED2360399.1 colicin immunity protein Cui [Serratia marcescens]HED3030528.1 colicin immunity protein Cui [Serratia marcescens]HED3714157.1 colicin immunity protein Cui [Serratia marcescens]
MYAWKKFFLIALAGCIPLFIIFFTYQTSPNNEIFKSFIDITKNANSNISSKNILLSKPLGMYTRLAIPLAIYFVLKYSHGIKLKENAITSQFVLTKFIPFTLISIIYVYFMGFYSLDVTTGNRFLKLISSNDYLLLSYYIVSFVGVYLFTMLPLLTLKKMFELIKNANDK